MPFENQNLYVLRFGRSYGPNMYFVNEGDAPTLYLRNGDFLENAAAQNARWYPISPDYNYTRPIYVSLAPSWNDYTAMGWYPGMVTYGGMWGYQPGVHFVWMPGFSIHIGGARYTDYVSYHNYYTRTPGYVRTRVVYNNYVAPGRTGSFGSRRAVGSTGSFGMGRSSGSTGSFGSSSFSRSAGGFGSSSGSNGSFGSRRSFGSGSFGASAPTGAFGSSGTGSRSCFGGGSSSFGRSSFGGGSSSFGGGHSSFGGGGSFGRRRR